jgi:hypothetical protein
MTIQPLSDIILDVANAADPVRAAATKEKLAQASGVDFASLLSGSAPSSVGQKWSDVSHARFFSDTTGKPLALGTGADEAKRGLETLIAKMLIETMLPKEGPATYGQGTAGDAAMAPQGALVAKTELLETANDFREVTIPVTDPGGVNELFFIAHARTPQKSGVLDLNWINFTNRKK